MPRRRHWKKVPEDDLILLLPTDPGFSYDTSQADSHRIASLASWQEPGSGSSPTNGILYELYAYARGNYKIFRGKPGAEDSAAMNELRFLSGFHFLEEFDLGNGVGDYIFVYLDDA
jgi:hypothetical protein